MHAAPFLRQIRLLPQFRRPGQHRTFIDHRRIASLQVPAAPDRLAGFVRDDAITEPVVRLKNENGEIGEPQDLRRIMRNIDRKTHTVVQLSKPGTADTPVVQIYSIMDLLKRVRENEDRAKQQERAARDKRPKQIELNWAISEKDLELKLKQFESFLVKGKKVELLLAGRKHQRKATIEEGNSVLAKIKEKIEETGAKEVKPMTGEVLKQVSIIAKKG